MEYLPSLILNFPEFMLYRICFKVLFWKKKLEQFNNWLTIINLVCVFGQGFPNSLV